MRALVEKFFRDPCEEFTAAFRSHGKVGMDIIHESSYHAASPVTIICVVPEAPRPHSPASPQSVKEAGNLALQDTKNRIIHQDWPDGERR